MDRPTTSETPVADPSRWAKLTSAQKAACEAVCKIRYRVDGDGCECAVAGPYVEDSCGCQEIALAAVRAYEGARWGVDPALTGPTPLPGANLSNRRAFMRYLQRDNKCAVTAEPCADNPHGCGCWVELEGAIRDER